MKQIKAKMLACLLTVSGLCAVAGVTTAVAAPINSQISMTAKAEEKTQEQLAAEFTGGKFTVSQYREDMTFEYVNAADVVEGATGTMLKITGTGNDGTTTGGAFATFNFSNAKAIASGVDVVVKVYVKDSTNEGRNFRVWGGSDWIGSMTKDYFEGWHDIVLDSATIAKMTASNGNLTSLSLGMRRGTVCYIGGIEIVEKDVMKEFTNNGQFQVMGGTRPCAVSFVDGAAEGLPEGYSGSVLKVGYYDGYNLAELDFSKSKILASTVKSIKVRCYLPDFKAADSDEFRTLIKGGQPQIQYGPNAYDLTGWCDVELISTSMNSMIDADGYLTSIDVGIRNKGTTGAFYIDSVTIDVADASTAETVVINAIDLYGNGLTSPANNRLFLKTTDGTKLSQNAGAIFKYVSGTGFAINGERKDAAVLESQKSYFRFKMDSDSCKPQPGDVVTVGGTFYCIEENMFYEIADTTFLYDENGEWGKNAAYTTSALGQLSASSSKVTSTPRLQSYFKAETTIKNTGWDYVYFLDSGNGVQINGTTLSKSEYTMKAPDGSLFIELNTVPTEGDVLTISGVFRCPGAKVKIDVAETQFTWNGSAWIVVVPEVEYTIHELGKLAVHNNSNGSTSNKPAATAIYMKRADGGKLPFATGWDDEFLYESGDGVKINGVAYAGFTWLESTDAGMYMTLAGIEVGTVVLIGGTFVCEEQAAKYVIEESKFVWNGTAWEDYVEYTVIDTAYATYQQVGGGNKQLYLLDASGKNFQIATTENDLHWTTAFSWTEGAISVEGTAVIACVKFPGQMFVEFSTAPAVGDILTINGTFYSSKLAYKYNIGETKLVFNGTKWEKYIEYTTYTATKLGAWMNDAKTQLFIYPTGEGEGFPKPGDWDNFYTFEVGSGTGITYNGETSSITDIKQPGDFFINLGKAPEKGDVFNIDGTYYNATTARKFVFENCTLYYNGTAWTNVQPVEYKTFTINGVAQTGAVDGTTFNLYVTDGDALTVSSWDYAFTLESGAGFALNGEAFTPTTLKQPGSDLYIDLGKAFAKGDVLTINGTFVNETAAAKITFVNCTLYFNGTAWSTEAPVEYTTYDLGALEVHANGGTAKSIYLKSPLIATANLPVKTWEHVFTLESGAGLKVNGEQKTLKTFKSTGEGLYFDFDAVNVGDVITISGTFYNETFATKYTITENQLQWNGTKWVEYIEYTTYTATKVGATKDSTASVLYLYSAEGDLFPKDKASWDYKYTLETGSGNGFMLNDTVLTTGDIKLPGDLYVELGATAVKGDKLTINGTYYNETTAVKIAFVNCTLYFDGEKWTDTKPVEYTVYEIGALKLHANGGSATNIYTKRADGGKLPFSGWENPFVLESGDGLKVNGEKINLAEMQSSPAGLWFRFAALKAGDVLTISGTFRCEKQKIEYVIEESSFIWSGSVWANYVDTSAYAAYTATRIAGYSNGTNNADLNIYPTGKDEAFPKPGDWNNVYTFEVCSGTGMTYNGNALNVTEIKQPGDFYIKVGITPAAGDVFVIDGTYYNTAKQQKFVFVNCEIHYDGTKWVTVDNNYAQITLNTTLGGTTETVDKHAAYQLPEAKTYNSFIGWLDTNGNFYQAGETVDFATMGYTFTAVELDFTLEEGAAIRINNTADESGIRFTTMLNQANYEALLALADVANVSYGTLIMPYDYLGNGQAPNLENFVNDETILKIPSTKHQVTEDGYIMYYGAMQKMFVENYGRAFAGRGYMEISFANGETMTVYTPFTYADNVRSIRYVAQAYKADNNSDYATLTDAKKAVVDAYAMEDEIRLMNYAAQAATNMMNITIWEYPKLDSANNYMNEGNIAIAEKMKAAGVKVVNLTGEGQVNMDTAANIEENRKIINFFWSQGLKTVAFAETKTIVENFKNTQIPDFSDCEGFIGFIMIDEPGTQETMDLIAEVAVQFNTLYAGTGVTYMNNLLPSEAGLFQRSYDDLTLSEKLQIAFGGSVDTLKKDEFKAYVKSYCDKVLTKIDGEKWLSIDSYPILSTGKLQNTFLFDLGVLAYYAEEYGATSHIALQSSAGWGKDKVPTEAEMRMQAYAAMAFGIDSISWFTYADTLGLSASSSPDATYTSLTSPEGDEATYNAFKAVNNEILALDEVYKAFKWQGVILGAKSGSSEYDAYMAVKGQIGGYELTANQTKYLSSVSTDKNLNYLMGVMQDLCGNEGYVICNYNQVYNKDSAQTITMNFAKNVTKAIIYRGGVATEVEVSNQTLQVALENGEGVMVLPSQIG